MISYYNFGRSYTPFSVGSFQQKLAGLGFVKASIFKSRIVIVRNLRIALLASLVMPFKTFIVWTNEPRHDWTVRVEARGFLGQKIIIFNVYNKNVFIHNFHFFKSYHFNHTNNLGITGRKIKPIQLLVSNDNFKSRSLLIGAFSKKDIRSFNWRIGNIGSIDGNELRQRIIETAIANGFHAHIIGKGWGELAQESSGFCDEIHGISWWDRKIELMRRYKFSIAIENTIYPYYVTEKIWQSIEALCLPIYVGTGSSIYETFAQDSFVDASDWNSPLEMIDWLSMMTYEEWCSRMNKCIDAYNLAIKKIDDMPSDPFSRAVSLVKSAVLTSQLNNKSS